MKYRSSKKIFSFLYFSIGSLIAAIFVGLFLLYCVYMLPTARMRYNVNRSLTYIQAENDSYMWAPYQKAAHWMALQTALCWETPFMRANSPLSTMHL